MVVGREEAPHPPCLVSLFIHQLVILHGHCFIILELRSSPHITITTGPYQGSSSPGLAVLLVVGCLGDQAELLLRTGASFLTLTSSLLPGEQTFENFPEYL